MDKPHRPSGKPIARPPKSDAPSRPVPSTPPLARAISSERAEYLAHRAAAEEIHRNLTGERIRHEQRQGWPGRRSDDHRPWIALIIVAFLAAMTHAVPADWPLEPARAQQECRP